MAAALLIPGGVYAYQKMIHSRTISYYLGDLDRIAEHRDALKAIVMENEALRLTVDAVLSDGHRTIILKTMESKTGETENHKPKNRHPALRSGVLNCAADSEYAQLLPDVFRYLFFGDDILMEV